MSNRVDVARIGFHRQGGEPCGDTVPGLPLRMGEGLAFAQRAIEQGETQRGTALDSRVGDFTLDGCELKRQRWHRTRQATERFHLKALDVELDEGRRSVTLDQRV